MDHLLKQDCLTEALALAWSFHEGKAKAVVGNFLEEISSLSHSVVSLYFFALIAEEGFRISLCYSLLVVKNPPANAEDTTDAGLIPGSGRSPEEGNGNPLQYSCLDNSRDRRAGRLQSMGLQRVGHD